MYSLLALTVQKVTRRYITFYVITSLRNLLTSKLITDVPFLSQSCRTMDTGPVHHTVCQFTYQLMLQYQTGDRGTHA